MDSACDQPPLAECSRQDRNVRSCRKNPEKTLVARESALIQWWRYKLKNTPMRHDQRDEKAGVGGGGGGDESPFG
jgi:hypothetical protein